MSEECEVEHLRSRLIYLCFHSPCIQLADVYMLRTQTCIDSPPATFLNGHVARREERVEPTTF